MSQGQAPEWQHWDGDTMGRHFHGKEITIFSGPKPARDSTTYRNDYPTPPLYWQHQPPPDHSGRPTPAFGHTTSHRADFTEHRLGNNSTNLRPYPEQKFNPKLSQITTSRDSYQIQKLPPRQPRKDPANAWQGSSAPIGTTTMRADYLEWQMPQRREKKGEESPKPTKFHGTTTTRQDFPWPKELPPPARTLDKPEHVVPKFEGTTEYRAAYEPVRRSLNPAIPPSVAPSGRLAIARCIPASLHANLTAIRARALYRVFAGGASGRSASRHWGAGRDEAVRIRRRGRPV